MKGLLCLFSFSFSISSLVLQFSFFSSYFLVLIFATFFRFKYGLRMIFLTLFRLVEIKMYIDLESILHKYQAPGFYYNLG